MTNRNSKLGKQIRTAASEAGLTLRALGDIMGVSRPTIYAYVSGALNVPESRLAQICAATGKDASFFDCAGDRGRESAGADSIKLIDALLSPPDAREAGRLAIAVAERVEEVQEPADLARLLFRTGNGLLQQGEYLDATDQLEQARRMFLEQGNTELAAACSQSLGFCWTNFGQLDRARSCFEYARRYSTPDKRWTGEVSLAALAQREGEFDEAESMLEALKGRTDLSSRAEAYVAANVADLLCARGLWVRALGQIEVALALAYRERLRDQAAELLIQKGTALTLLGDFEGASLSIVRAGDVCFSLSDEARSTLQQLAWGRLLAFLGRLGDARKTVVLAMSTATRGQYRRSESLALRLLADIALTRGDIDQAHDYAIQAISHAETHRYPAEGAAARITLVLAQCAMGQTVKAEETLNLAEEICQTLGLGDAGARILRAKAHLACARGCGADWLQAADSALDMGLVPLAAQIMWEATLAKEPGTDEALNEAFGAKAQALASRLLGQRILWGPGGGFSEELVSVAEWLGQACV